MKQAAGACKSKMEERAGRADQPSRWRAPGGGLAVKLSGKGEMKVKIDDTLMKPSEKEIVEDHRRRPARRAAQGRGAAAGQDETVAGGLPLPPGLKLF